MWVNTVWVPRQNLVSSVKGGRVLSFGRKRALVELHPSNNLQSQENPQSRKLEQREKRLSEVDS